MSILKIKDAQGNWKEIPAISGGGGGGDTTELQKEIGDVKKDLSSVESKINPITGSTDRMTLEFINGYYNDKGVITDVSWAKRTEKISLVDINAIIFDGAYINFPAGFTNFYQNGVVKYSISEGSLSRETLPYIVNCTEYDEVAFSFNSTGLSDIVIYAKSNGNYVTLLNDVDVLKKNNDFAPRLISDFAFPIAETFEIYKENIVLLDNEQGITDYLADDMTDKTFSLRQNTVGKKTYAHFIYNVGMTDAVSRDISISYKTPNKTAKNVMLLGDSTIDSSPTSGISPEAKALRDEYGSNLTLIGTRGTNPYKHCGIGGWSASDWWNLQSYGDNINPFFNPSVNHFDFGYGISQNNLIAPNIVIVQLGINDVTGATEPSRFNLLCDAYVQSMQNIVNNIKAYRSDIKVYVNLIIPPSKDWLHYMAYAGAYLSPNIAKQHNIIASSRILSELKNADGFLPINCIIDRDNDLADRVHPNVTGYEKIGQFLSKCLSVIE